jgi:AcrR family transcriptional regulator
LAIVGTQELADAAGVSRQRIYQWSNEGLPGKVSRGKWDSELALAWIAERREDRVAEDSGRSLTELRANLIEAQTVGQQIRNDILAAHLVFRETAQTAFQEAFAAVVGHGDQWVREGRTAEDIQARQVLWHGLRAELAESTRRVAGTLSRGEDIGSSRLRLARRLGG